MLVGWPLNSYVMKRSIRIQKGVSTSRDKRMAVLNELISAVKFIKFFAWEGRWIDRVMDARGVEMGWMVKGGSPFHSRPLTDNSYNLPIVPIIQPVSTQSCSLLSGLRHLFSSPSSRSLRTCTRATS